eukprot:jgi/Hompol1/3427/HPOL_006526-RA
MQVAIKVMLKGSPVRSDVSGLPTEASIQGSADHPNIVKLIDTACDEYGKYIVMERFGADWRPQAQVTIVQVPRVAAVTGAGAGGKSGQQMGSRLRLMMRPSGTT